MAKRSASHASRLRISDERRQQLRESLKRYFGDEFEQPLSDFKADTLLDLVIREIGPAIYNLGVRDAASYMQAKIADLDTEVYEPEA